MPAIQALLPVTLFPTCKEAQCRGTGQPPGLAALSFSALQIHRAMQRFLTGDPAAAVADLPPRDSDQICSLFESLKIEDGEERHKHWLQAIRKGAFSLGGEIVTYRTAG
ncbi:MAG: hypothetical protein GY697_21115 [Desulfobacterales bacterium]|nr:hypothetical protein [Desulfobacterales bacterium]